MVLKLDDPNEAHRQEFLKMLNGSDPSEISDTVANYRRSIANSKSACRIDKTTANQLQIDVSSFRRQCAQIIEDMDKTYHKRITKKKPVKAYDDELSERENYERLFGGEDNVFGWWTPAPYDPNKLIAFFPCLKLRKGYHLGSYQNQDAKGNDRAYTFAIPQSHVLPKRPPQKALEYMLLADMNMLREKLTPRRPLPKWADRNIESYLEGDGTPLSYFEASIYLREIYELGSMWHCSVWSHHKLVTDPQQLPVEEGKWYEPEPKDWCPVVWKDKVQRWNVTFYTFDDMNANLVFHNDTFIKGYEFETFSTSIALYPGGYMV